MILSNFIIFGNWTDQGIKTVSELPERVIQGRKMIENAGGKMQFFTTMGKYDFVLLVEIPKDEDMAAILLCVGSMGNIRTTTMKAWTEAEAAKLLTGTAHLDSNPNPSQGRFVWRSTENSRHWRIAFRQLRLDSLLGSMPFDLIFLHLPISWGASDTSDFGVANPNTNHHPRNIGVAVGRIETDTKTAVTVEIVGLYEKRQRLRTFQNKNNLL
jgi:uncharacterized protein with GYD domain